MVNLTDPPTSEAPSATDLRLAALERLAADLTERLQLAEAQNLALEARVTVLGDSVADLHGKAFMLKTLEEIRAGVWDDPRSHVIASRPRVPRHLHAIQGGGS